MEECTHFGRARHHQDYDIGVPSSHREVTSRSDGINLQPFELNPTSYTGICDLLMRVQDRPVAYESHRGFNVFKHYNTNTSNKFDSVIAGDAADFPLIARLRVPKV